MNDPHIYNWSFLSQKKKKLIYWMTLIHIIGPSSVKKNTPYLSNDPHIYNWSFLSQKQSPLFIEWPSYILLVLPQSKKIPLIYRMTLIYIISPSSVKKFPLIYWMTLIYIIGPSSVKKNPPYLLNDPHIYNWSFLSQNISPLFIEWPSYV